MRHIYNCEQMSIPRAISCENLSENSPLYSSTNSIGKGPVDGSFQARFVLVS